MAPALSPQMRTLSAQSQTLSARSSQEAAQAGALLERVEAVTGRNGPAAALVDFASALGSMQRRRPQERRLQPWQHSNAPTPQYGSSPGCALERMRWSKSGKASIQTGVVREVAGETNSPRKTYATVAMPTQDRKGAYPPSTPQSARSVQLTVEESFEPSTPRSARCAQPRRRAAVTPGKATAAAAAAAVAKTCVGFEFASKELLAEHVQREQKQRSKQLTKQHQEQLTQIRELQKLFQEPVEEHEHLKDVFEPLRLMKKRMTLHIKKEEAWDLLASVDKAEKDGSDDSD